jgi:hypothetical protein
LKTNLECGLEGSINECSGGAMSFISGLPPGVVNVLTSAFSAEFATVTSAGVPIDTPMLVFPSQNFATIDVCTGLAYPAKAERARNNPKVGLLFQGGRKGPVISIAGIAAVRDSDIQANTLRYISETAYARPLNPPWATARKAVYYWSRMLIAITPVRVLWWDRADGMDAAPKRWDVPQDTVYPKSDPKPPGSPASANKWAERPWCELAHDALERGQPGHLTVCDDDGYPLPFAARAVKLTSDGFWLDIPMGSPWRRTGTASLTFVGRETFIGHILDTGSGINFTVERPLPINPLSADHRLLWDPSAGVSQAMMRRLTQELSRRGQPIPELPDEEPLLTPNAQVRRDRLADPDTDKWWT